MMLVQSLLPPPDLVIIRLEVRLQPIIGFPRRVLSVFTRSAITAPKVNRFGWNLEHSEYIVGLALADFGRYARTSVLLLESQAKCFARKQLTISPISRRPNFTKFEHNTSISVAIKTIGTKLRYALQGSVDTLVRSGGQLSSRAMSNYVRNFCQKLLKLDDYSSTW